MPEMDNLEKLMRDFAEAMYPRWTVEPLSRSHDFISFIVTDASGRTYDVEVFAQR